MTAKLRRIALGRVEYTDLEGNRGFRFFTVAAGIGVDAHLFYKLNPLVKGHLGMAAYYAKATRLWLTHPMEKFAVEVDRDAEQNNGQGSALQVSQLLAVRIRNFGGVLRELAPGASLDRDDLRHGIVSHFEPLGLFAVHHTGTGRGTVAGERNRPGAQPKDRLPAAG